MAEDRLGPLWSSLVWLGGGLAFHLLKGYCGREMEALSSAKKIKHLKDLSKVAEGDKKEGTPDLVAVVGRVNAVNPVACKNSKVPAVILQESVEQYFLRQVGGNSWVKDSTILMGSKQHVPWFLEDSSGRAYVINGHQATGFELVVASDVVEEPAPTNTMRTLLDIGQGIRVLCVRRVEKALPVGTVLTVVGEAVKLDKEKVALRRPRSGGAFFVSTKGLDLLISEFGSASSWCKWLSISCLAIGVATLAAHGVILFLEKRRAGREASAILNRNQSRHSAHIIDTQGNLSRSGDSHGGDSAHSHCVVCLDQKYNVAFFPCGHVCCCKDCGEGLHYCPLCRQRISQKKLVYVH